MKNPTKLNRIFCLALALLLLCAALSGCRKEAQKEGITSIGQLKDKNAVIAADAGSSADKAASSSFPSAQRVYTQGDADGFLKVQTGKADAYLSDRLFIEYAQTNGGVEGLMLLPEVLGEADICAGINPEREDLLPLVNSFIAEMKANGILDDMFNRWFRQQSDIMPQIEKPQNPQMKIRIGTSGIVPPMTYFGSDGALTGFDIELSLRLALYLNAEITIEDMGYDALLASLQSDRLDIVFSDLNATPERREVILMSEPYRISQTSAVVKRAETSEIKSLDDLKGKKIGYLFGSAYEYEIREKFKDSEILFFNSPGELIEALKNGRISGYITEEPSAIFHMSEVKGLKTIKGVTSGHQSAFLLRPGAEDIRDDFNGVIKELEAEGVLKSLESKWINGKGESKIEPPYTTGERGVLKIAVPVDAVPFAYQVEDRLLGYDIELVQTVAARLGYTPKLTVYDFDALLTAVTTGKEDVALGLIAVTEERMENSVMTRGIFEYDTVMVVLDGQAEKEGFLASLKDSLRRTFITENRWKLLLEGLLVTIELSVLSVFFGTLAGIGYSFLLRSKYKAVAKVANWISVMMDGLPQLIILMVLYYIIFAKSSLSAAAIGVLGLSLDFANCVAATLLTGIDAVPRGEIEAAESMGYSRMKIFKRITFPRAVNRMFSSYSGSVISLIKGTSIVGYITVHDLTKAGDIIRSRTYEAFFPLIVTAVIYFVLARIFVWILEQFAKKLDPKNRKRRVKGVEADDKH